MDCNGESYYLGQLAELIKKCELVMWMTGDCYIPLVVLEEFKGKHTTTESVVEIKLNGFIRLSK